MPHDRSAMCKCGLGVLLLIWEKGEVLAGGNFPFRYE